MLSLRTLASALPVLVIGLGSSLAAQEENPRIAPARVERVRRVIDAEYAALEKLYQHLHAHPELSLEEERTAARLAEELTRLGAKVTTGVGGHGVVAVVEQGRGPVVMLRADMDALPIAEETGLPYASQVRTRDRQGRDVGVMHACGHDINMTCLVGVARVLTALKDEWGGTLVLVGQPAEEIGSGAKSMLDDGLFHRFPRPEVCYALHCDARDPHGVVNYRAGQMQANVDTVDIVVRGKGGHGAAPHTTIDPVVLASRIVLDLQTIVSRELNPLEPAVVTVGSIHGGTKHNVIPSEVRLQLTVRTTTDATRAHVLAAIGRIARGVAASAGAPPPTVEVDEEQYTPALVNDPEITAETVALLRELLGAEQVRERPMSLGGEDFSRYVRAGVPGCYFFVGTAPPERVKEAEAGGPPLPLTHTAHYFPIPEPTIKTGVLAMSITLLDRLARDPPAAP
jgi:amidohydrolase